MDRRNIIQRIATLLGLVGIPLAACDYEDEPLEYEPDGDFIDERHLGDDDVDDITQEGDAGAPWIGTVTPTVPVMPTTVTVATIDLDPTLSELCALPRGRTFFEFDSARVTGDGRELLDQVATCMTLGPLSEQGIDLVGYTDPVGSKGYNKQLGADRAAAVKDYLVQKGIDPMRIDTASQGEIGAMTNDLGLAKDRRVAIRLGDVQDPEATAGLEADEY